jgi:hypothetical protein
MTPKATASTFRKRAGMCKATTKVQLSTWFNPFRQLFEQLEHLNGLNFY